MSTIHERSLQCLDQQEKDSQTLLRVHFLALWLIHDQADCVLWIDEYPRLSTTSQFGSRTPEFVKISLHRTIRSISTRRSSCFSSGVVFSNCRLRLGSISIVFRMHFLFSLQNLMMSVAPAKYLKYPTLKYLSKIQSSCLNLNRFQMVARDKLLI